MAKSWSVCKLRQRDIRRDLNVIGSYGCVDLDCHEPNRVKSASSTGGAYLLKMGWDCLRADVSVAPELDQKNKMASTYYQRALMSNLLNPKALVFFVMFLPQFVSSNITASSGEQMLALGLLLNVLGLLFNILLVALAGTLGKGLLENDKFRMYQGKLMGLVFVILAVWMLSSFAM